MILKTWECEYVVAPVYDDDGIVGLVSPAFKMPLPAYGGAARTRPLPRFPHIADSFSAFVDYVNDRDEGVAVDWRFQPHKDEFRDPKTDELKPGGYNVVRPWDSVFIVPGDLAHEPVPPPPGATVGFEDRPGVRKRAALHQHPGRALQPGRGPLE